MNFQWAKLIHFIVIFLLIYAVSGDISANRIKKSKSKMNLLIKLAIIGLMFLTGLYLSTRLGVFQHDSLPIWIMLKFICSSIILAYVIFFQKNEKYSTLWQILFWFMILVCLFVSVFKV